ncbi:unnamed protein product, partial [marine sediment metagenome]
SDVEDLPNPSEVDDLPEPSEAIINPGEDD